MNSFTKRLLTLFSGIAGCAVCATALTAVVEYKPWGVPDSRREDYDAKISELDRRSELRERYENANRPIISVAKRHHRHGLQDPETKGSHRFEVQNAGQTPLELSVGSTGACETLVDSPQVKPGESTFLTVTWTTGTDPGSFEHIVDLNSNDPLTDSIQLRVSGTTKAALVVPEKVSFSVSDPATRTDTSFVVHSQTWKDFKIVDVTSDLKLFDWHAEPVEAGDPDLEGTHAESAWRVRLWTTSMEYGEYSGTVTLVIEAADGQVLERAVAASGKVRTPIIFHSPEIHMTDGLDIGTRFSGKEYQFHLLVRVRGDLDRKIEVLEVQPPELKATLTPQATRGNYRLTLTIPADCPMVVFNIPEKHGFVEVGDPNDKHFKNWFPVHGAVVPSQ